MVSYHWPWPRPEEIVRSSLMEGEGEDVGFGGWEVELLSGGSAVTEETVPTLQKCAAK